MKKTKLLLGLLVVSSLLSYLLSSATAMNEACRQASFSDVNEIRISEIPTSPLMISFCGEVKENHNNNNSRLSIDRSGEERRKENNSEEGNDAGDRELKDDFSTGIKEDHIPFDELSGRLSNNRADCFINSSLQLCKGIKDQLDPISLQKMPWLSRFFNGGCYTDKESKLLRQEMATEVIKDDSDLRRVIQDGTAESQEDAAAFLRLLLAETKHPLLFFEETLINQFNHDSKAGNPKPSIMLSLAFPNSDQKGDQISNSITLQQLINNEFFSKRRQRWSDEDFTFPEVEVERQLRLRDPIPSTIVISLSRFKNDLSKNKVSVSGIDQIIRLPTANDNEATYKPIAIICHDGQSLNAGHYICYRIENGKWMLFDDDKDIKSLSYQESSAFHDSKKIKGDCYFNEKFISQNCYVITYQKELSQNEFLPSLASNLKDIQHPIIKCSLLNNEEEREIKILHKGEQLQKDGKEVGEQNVDDNLTFKSPNVSQALKIAKEILEQIKKDKIVLKPDGSKSFYRQCVLENIIERLQKSTETEIEDEWMRRLHDFVVGKWEEHYDSAKQYRNEATERKQKDNTSDTTELEKKEEEESAKVSIYFKYLSDLKPLLDGGLASSKDATNLLIKSIKDAATNHDIINPFDLLNEYLKGLKELSSADSSSLPMGPEKIEKQGYIDPNAKGFESVTEKPQGFLNSSSWSYKNLINRLNKYNDNKKKNDIQDSIKELEVLKDSTEKYLASKKNAYQKETKKANPSSKNIAQLDKQVKACELLLKGILVEQFSAKRSMKISDVSLRAEKMIGNIEAHFSGNMAAPDIAFYKHHRPRVVKPFDLQGEEEMTSLIGQSMGIPSKLRDANLPGRAVATYKIDQLLLCGIVPKTELAITQGGNIGSAQILIKDGKQLYREEELFFKRTKKEVKDYYIKGDFFRSDYATEEEFDEALEDQYYYLIKQAAIGNTQPLKKFEHPLRLSCKEPLTQIKTQINGEEKTLIRENEHQIDEERAGELLEEGKLFFEQKIITKREQDINFSSSILQKAMANAQLLDLLTGQLDRHPGNFMYTQLPNEDWRLGLIDNDLSFPRLFDSLSPEKLGDINLMMGYHVFQKLPRYIDSDMANRILDLSSLSLRKELAGTGLSEEEIVATENRLKDLQQHIHDIQQGKIENGRLISDWNQDTFQYLTEQDEENNYIIRSINMIREIKAQRELLESHMNNSAPNNL